MQSSITHTNKDEQLPSATELKLIPLECLDTHPDNVRKTPLSPQDQAELNASIRHQGLIEPLSCMPAEDNAGQYLVFAGGRRLTSLRFLAKTDQMPEAFALGIPCQIWPITSDATLLSMSENKVRFAMNIADEIVAWRDLFNDGYSVDQIASRFGVDNRLVSRRLKLAGLIPDIIDLLRDHIISLETAAAFAILGDAAKQSEALESLGDPADISANQVRRFATKGKYTMANTEAQIVGLDAYRAAGGSYITDLFNERSDGSDILLTDPYIVERLLDDIGTKLEAQLIADGWKWVEISNQPYYCETLYKTHQIKAAEAELTDDEQTQFDEWITILTSEEEKARLTPLELRDMSKQYQDLTNLTEARRYSPKIRAKSGVVVRYANGVITIEYARGANAQASGDRRATDKILPSSDQPKSLYSNAMQDDIGHIRTSIVREALLCDQTLATAVIAYKLATQLLTKYTNICGISASACALDNHEDKSLARNALSYIKQLDRDWLDQPTDAKRFAAFLELPLDKQVNWITWAVSASLHITMTNNQDGAAEALVSKLDIDWPAIWRPRADFWQRVSKDAITEMLTPVLGEDWIRNHAALKRVELAKILEDIFAGNSNSINATQAEAVKNWQIPGLAPSAKDNATQLPATQPTSETSPQFTVTKAHLRPVRGENSETIWVTEEIEPGSSLDTSVATQAEEDVPANEYAHASQSAAISPPQLEVMDVDLAAVAGSEKAQLVEAMGDKITFYTPQKADQPSSNSVNEAIDTADLSADLSFAELPEFLANN